MCNNAPPADQMLSRRMHYVQEAESDSVRNSTLDWWDVVMSTRVNDPKTTAMVIVMQHSMQLKAERRFSKGLWLLAAFTWSKNIDQDSTNGEGQYDPLISA